MNSRWIYNVCHWALGGSLLFMSLACIYISPKLPGMEFVDSKYFTMLVTIHLGIFALVNFLLTALNARRDAIAKRRAESEGNSEMQTMNGYDMHMTS